tara:strand:- start:1229 stop:1582 length:354 start_codon:yes stop_codon:yes gene_type:complete
MAVVTKVDKKVKLSNFDIIKYQILTYCFLNNIQISPADLNCLSKLAKLGNVTLTEFCELISEDGIFKSPQSCRNAIQKAKLKGLVIKDGKKISIIEDMNLQHQGVIFLDFKFLSIAE